MNRTVKLAAAALAVAFTAAAAPGTITPAEAKKIIIVKKGFGHRHFHHRHYFGPAFVVASYGYGSGCHWMKVKAYNTGSAYWWDRYNHCIGG